MTQVCDFSDQGINLPAVKAVGLTGIISYCSDTLTKNLSKANFDQALSLGLTVNLVCEQGNQPALRGAAGGAHDAQISNDQANVLGYDPTAAIYYVAEDPSTLPAMDWPTVEAYFRALSGRPVGAYGSLKLVTHLINLGLANYGWVVQTWGGTNGQVHLEQLVGANTFGLPIDVDTVLKADYGQMPRPAGPSGGDVPAPTDVVATWSVPGTDGGQYFDLHADGGLFAYGGAVPTELEYVACGNDGSRYHFGPKQTPGVISYPGLPPQAGTRHFVAMTVLTYNNTPANVGPAGPPGPPGTPVNLAAIHAAGASLVGA